MLKLIGKKVRKYLQIDAQKFINLKLRGKTNLLLCPSLDHQQTLSCKIIDWW